MVFGVIIKYNIFVKITLQDKKEGKRNDKGQKGFTENNSRT